MEKPGSVSAGKQMYVERDFTIRTLQSVVNMGVLYLREKLHLIIE